MPKPTIRITSDGIAGGPSPKNDQDDPNEHQTPDKGDIPNNEDPIRDQIISEIEKERRDIIGDTDVPDYDSLDTEELKLLLDNIRKKKKDQENDRQGSNNRIRIELPDGSVFEKITTESKWYDSYYYVVYDRIHKPILMNWWTCIDEYTIRFSRYIYISGPTQSLPDEIDTEKTNEWRYDFNSVPLNKARIFWNEGRHNVGDNSGGFVIPEDDVQTEDDPTDSQFEALFEEWQKGKSTPKVGTPQPDSSGSSKISGVKVGDRVIPSEFFTKPHTLKELIELKLVDGRGFTQGLLDNLTQAKVLFYLQYFPYSEK